MVKRMGITGTRLMSSAGLITLQVDADPSKIITSMASELGRKNYFRFRMDLSYDEERSQISTHEADVRIIDSRK